MKAPWKTAATIIMLSRRTGRVLLLRRGETAQFMPGALVFPGGTTNQGETAEQTALRELFEETGVLCARDGIVSAASDDQVREWQDKVNGEGGAEWFEHNLLSRLSTSSLLPWSTWLTPNAGHYVRRYMTHFFVLPVDDEPAVRYCEREMAGYAWADPGELVKDAFSGSASLPPPQVYELTRLAQKDIHSLSADSSPILFPQVLIPEDGENLMVNVLPGDHMYIDDPTYMQGTRTMSIQEIEARPKDKAFHRLTYFKDPLYAKCRIDITEHVKKLGFTYFQAKL